MLERLYALEQFGIKLGLANIQALCDALAHPERAFASLHVAGTNGKGSVTAMAHKALRASGVHAARYTSPHLVHLNERFVIGDEAVDDAQLESTAARVLDCADALVADGRLRNPPTFFEATTAIAFELFRRAGVEVAVLEVGLGGRFDATNVVDPVATAVTSIGLDHQQHLGDTLEQIAYEKAGVIKAGVPVVVGQLPPEALQVITNVARERNAPIVRAHASGFQGDCDVVVDASSERPIVTVTTPHHRYGPVRLALRGDHQALNAVVAIRLLEQAREAGIRVTPEAIESGLAHTEWPARLELLRFAGGRQLILDAAHNLDGAVSLARYLARYYRERPPLVFAAMRDKEISAMLRALLPVSGQIIMTRPPSERSSTPEDLREVAKAIDASRDVIVECDPIQAVERAWAHGDVVCVAGSIFLAGAVRGAFQSRAIVGSSP